MSFKVGDKIRLIGMTNEEDYYKKYLGEIFTIKEVEDNFVTVKEDVDIAPYFQNIELVKEYTYEDLKKSPVGTRVTFENSKVLIKIKNNYYEESKYEECEYKGFYRNDQDLENLEDNRGSCLLGKIIKIEEPAYSTVYEYKPEILDEVEKRYLRGVIRPFRDKVKTIKKGTLNINDEQYISINFENTANNFALPNFKKGTMYKGMGVDKKYTLEELGL